MSNLRQIFGVGGNFFVKAWQKPALQTYLLGLAKKRTPRICFLGAANGDNPADIELFYRQMNRHDCRPFHLSMAAPVTRDFADFFQSMDIIYVGGGATKNLISVWRVWGVDVALRVAWDAGVILSGTSAGSICWFKACITDSYPAEMLPLECIGLLPGSACTHYDARPDRPPTFRRLIADGTIPSPGLATDDDTAVHYIDGELHEVLTVRPEARAYRLLRNGDTFEEMPLDARLLGG